MNTKDEKPDGKNKDRTGGAEGGGPDKGDNPSEDSLELFSSLFRAETQALAEQERRASQKPKAGSPPGKAGVSPPAQRSGRPRAKAPAPGTQAPRTQVKGAPQRPTPQGPKAAGKAAAPPGTPKKGPAAPKKQAGPSPRHIRIPRPQGKGPAQGPPATGPGARQGASRGPSKAGAGGIPPKRETIQRVPELSLPNELRIPIKYRTKKKRGGGKKTLKLVILLAVLVVIAAFSLYYLGIIGPERPRHASTAVRRPHKKAQVVRKVQKKPPTKGTKAGPGSAKQAPVNEVQVKRVEVKQIQEQAAQQGAPVPEKPKVPAQQTKVTSAATTSEVRKPPAPPPAAKAPAPVAALSAYPYAVYLGSYQARKSLKRAVSEYRGMGLSPYWVQVDLGSKGIWYRLFTGYFPSREAAAAFIREKNIKDGKHRNTRYANLIGVSRSKQELLKPRLNVEEAGFCPYMVRGPHGQWMLYTGAFYQKVRAEKQNRELRSKGIQSRLVER